MISLTLEQGFIDLKTQGDERRPPGAETQRRGSEKKIGISVFCASDPPVNATLYFGNLIRKTISACGLSHGFITRA